MVLELHIWGPAFGLPSIDAECIAATAYVHRTLPPQSWILVADHDSSIGSRGEFPTLVNGPILATGFTAIVSFLKRLNPEKYDLDTQLTTQQQSLKTAFIAFLQSTATPLIDLSLYISSENYNTSTASSYTAILPWYLNYTVPPARRTLARSRTAHLGLNSLDVSTADQDEGLGLGNDFEAAKRSAGISADGRAQQPAIFRMGRGKGFQGLLGSPVYAARFRLDTLTNDLLEPLSEILGLKNNLFEGDKPTSVDCLAFGYLALMLYPPVPQSWLKEAIEKRFPLVANYVARMREELIDDDQPKAGDIWTLSPGKIEEIKVQAELRRLGLRLPWRPRSKESIFIPFVTVTGEIANNLPLLPSLLRSTARSETEILRYQKRKPSSLPSNTAINIFYAVSAVATAAFASLAIIHRRSPRDGDLIFWAIRPITGFGEAGDILSVLAGGLPRGLDALY